MAQGRAYLSMEHLNSITFIILKIAYLQYTVTAVLTVDVIWYMTVQTEHKSLHYTP